MSIIGRVLSVEQREQGSQTISDVLAGASVLVVEDPTDFDETGGTVEINGTRYAYVSLVEDETTGEGTLTLVTPLAEDVEAGSVCWVVLGGSVATDMYALVDIDQGDAVEVPIPYAERAMWAVGAYDDPIPVRVSDDLSVITDVLGKLPTVQSSSSGSRFRNTDAFTADGPGDQTLDLTFVPIDGSEHVYWNGLHQPPTEWTRVGSEVTLADADDLLLAGDPISVAYAYDTTSPGYSPVSELVAYGSSGWKYLQVALSDTTDYSAPGFDDSGWATGDAKFGNGVGTGSGSATSWVKDTSMWIRRTLPAATDLTIYVAVEDNCAVYIDGVFVGESDPLGLGADSFSTPFEVISSGGTFLAIRANDEAATNGGDETACDVRVTGRLAL